MIIVTGTPRSGTSWAMQDCMILGLDALGEKFSKYNIPAHNQKGYWELPPEKIVTEIKAPHPGKVVKIFGSHLSLINPAHIEKVIICLRDKIMAAESLSLWLQGSQLVEDEQQAKLKAKIIIKQIRHDLSVFLKENTAPVVRLPFEDRKAYPETYARALADFLGVSDQTLIDQVIDNTGV